MKLLLIGHRGVGKTSLLQRLQIYSSMRSLRIPVADLDREIEKATRGTVQQIFSEFGEANFRNLEVTYLQQMMKAPQWIIGCGAGIELDRVQVPEDAEVVWVQRTSDEGGRIFTDRPRLNPEMSAVAEFQSRRTQREKRFTESAHWRYDMAEGMAAPDEDEAEIFFPSLKKKWGGILTLQSHHLRSVWCLRKIEEFGFDRIELRTDLLTPDQVYQALEALPEEKFIFSFRNQQQERWQPHFSAILEKMSLSTTLFDWPMELGMDNPLSEVMRAQHGVLSLHERHSSESLSDSISKLEKHGQAWSQLKLAVPIHNFRELQQAMDWQQQDPQRRSFLPRSTDGSRWLWVRLWLKGRQPLNFVRVGPGSSADQPTLFQWMSVPSRTKKFAAVLGNPVLHSYSPVEHKQYFHDWEMPFFAVQVHRDDWREAIGVLEKMGMRAASVTAPLKPAALQEAHKKTSLAIELGTANTLMKSTEGWSAHNTDYEGLIHLLDSVESQIPVFIWGGGGTLPVIQKILPHAVAWSVREKTPRDQTRNKNESPQTVIWAASPSADMPPADWKPKYVIDLNYREDSRAREYALQCEAKYISGLQMFKEQAAAQQKFWDQELGIEAGAEL